MKYSEYPWYRCGKYREAPTFWAGWWSMAIALTSCLLQTVPKNRFKASFHVELMGWCWIFNCNRLMTHLEVCKCVDFNGNHFELVVTQIQDMNQLQLFQLTASGEWLEAIRFEDQNFLAINFNKRKQRISRQFVQVALRQIAHGLRWILEYAHLLLQASLKLSLREIFVHLGVLLCDDWTLLWTALPHWFSSFSTSTYC